MAGDWIKMRTNLDTDVRVLEMAELLSLSELHVVGCLWKLWSWADQHTHDGNAIRVTCVTLDRFTAVTGFADALRKVGWLEGRDGALTFPRFAEHNGQTAKNRAETKERVAKHRNAKSVTDVTQKVLPEKRREEKIKTKESEGDCDNLICVHLADDGFAKALADFRSMSSRSHHWLADDITVQAWLVELSRMELAEAVDALRFSISRGSKTPILNGDHKRKREAVGAGAGSAKGRKPIY